MILEKDCLLFSGPLERYLGESVTVDGLQVSELVGSDITTALTPPRRFLPELLHRQQLTIKADYPMSSPIQKAGIRKGGSMPPKP